jgi:hypothetical protein
MLTQIFMDRWIDIGIERVTSIKQDMELYVSSLIYYFAFTIGSLVLLIYTKIFWDLKRDLNYCYEIFNILDPFHIKNNRILEKQLHDCYTGIS